MMAMLTLCGLLSERTLHFLGMVNEALDVPRSTLEENLDVDDDSSTCDGFLDDGGDEEADDDDDERDGATEKLCDTGSMYRGFVCIGSGLACLDDDEKLFERLLEAMAAADEK